MSKRRIYTQPITKISLHWISTIEIYAIFAAMGALLLWDCCWLGALKLFWEKRRRVELEASFWEGWRLQPCC